MYQATCSTSFLPQALTYLRTVAIEGECLPVASARSSRATDGGCVPMRSATSACERPASCRAFSSASSSRPSSRSMRATAALTPGRFISFLTSWSWVFKKPLAHCLGVRLAQVGADRRHAPGSARCSAQPRCRANQEFAPARLRCSNGFRNPLAYSNKYVIAEQARNPDFNPGRRQTVAINPALLALRERPARVEFRRRRRSLLLLPLLPSLRANAER